MTQAHAAPGLAARTSSPRLMAGKRSTLAAVAVRVAPHARPLALE